MGSVLGGPAGQNSKQDLPSWARGVADWLFQGNPPGLIPQGGPFADALAGWQSATPDRVFGGLADVFGNAQQAGSMGRNLSSQATNQAYGNAMHLAAQGWGPVGQTQQIAGMVPGAMDAASYYLQRGVNPAVTGGNIIGGTGAGQQVVDAALGASTQFGPDMYRRVVEEGLPEVRASYSARGLGTAGAAARGEQEYISRTRDMLAQQEVQNRIAALGVGASAAGPAAQQAIGAQQAAAARGQLGLQASQAPGQILGQMQNVAGVPLDALAAMMNLQAGPNQQIAAGLQNFAQSLNLPLAYQQAVYEFTRDPQKSLLNVLAQQNQSSSKSDYRGVLGIPKNP